MQPQDTNQGGAFFYERGLDGKITNEYGSTGNSGLFYPQSQQPFGYGGCSCTAIPSVTALPAFWTAGAGPTLANWQSDALFDGVATIQGVRNISPDMGQWTTPDAYEGDISDPRTQSKYMWDNNNPEAYSDPSGYATCSENEGGKTTSCNNLQTIVTVKACAKQCVSDTVKQLQGFDPSTPANVGGVLSGFIPTTWFSKLSSNPAADEAFARAALRAGKWAGSALKKDLFHKAARQAAGWGAEHGAFSHIVGNDGVTRGLLSMPGGVGGYDGNFQWIIDLQSGDITHAMMEPH